MLRDVHEKRVAWVSISMHACDPVPIVMALRLALCRRSSAIKMNFQCYIVVNVVIHISKYVLRHSPLCNIVISFLCLGPGLGLSRRHYAFVLRVNNRN